MRKKDALDVLGDGSVVMTAAAMERTHSCVSQMPKILNRHLADQVIGAACRLGRAHLIQQHYLRDESTVICNLVMDSLMELEAAHPGREGHTCEEVSLQAGLVPEAAMRSLLVLCVRGLVERRQRKTQFRMARTQGAASE